MTTPVCVTLEQAADYDEWRAAARHLLEAGVRPELASFRRARSSADLFANPAPRCRGTDSSNPALRVPRAFPTLARDVLCNRDESRFALLYRLLWRLQEQSRLLENRADADVFAARRLANRVRRESHKMKAFVRFRRIEGEAGEAFVAWFEPEHHIVERTAPFFARRFAGMRWSIVTPERSAHWDGTALSFDDGAPRRDCPDDDALEAHWRVYYASIFNPARLKLDAMRAEMPVRYWRNMPESRLIPELSRSATNAQRTAPAGTTPNIATARRLVAGQPATRAAALPRTSGTLEAVAGALKDCARCGICRIATAPVPGEGPADSRLMIVGEQPGDEEDLAGRPFVGPAGRVLDEALAEAAIDRGAVYMTNAVKGFKFQPRGKRRIHKRPSTAELEHCRWWLAQERDLVEPAVTLALGASAARTLLGRTVRVNEVRGRALAAEDGRALVVTVHPAYLLRLPDADAARAERGRFIRDLMFAHSLTRKPA